MFVKCKVFLSSSPSPGTRTLVEQAVQSSPLVKTYPNKRVRVTFFFFHYYYEITGSGRCLLALPTTEKIRYPFDLLVPNPATFRERWDPMIMKLSWKRNCKLCPRPCNQLFMWVTLNSAGVPTGINFLTGGTVGRIKTHLGRKTQHTTYEPSVTLFILLFFFSFLSLLLFNFVC